MPPHPAPRLHPVKREFTCLGDFGAFDGGMIEIKQHPVYGDYGCSRDGSLWRLTRSRRSNGPFPMELKTHLDKKGYLKTSLYVNGKHIRVGPHVMILETFIGPRPEGYQAAHGNGIRTDNRLDNLRWATPRENSLDCVMHGRSIDGEKNLKVKLTETEVLAIRASGNSYSALAKQYGVTRENISMIVRGITWKRI